MTANLVRQGKVRDVYDVGDYYLMVASDRISAFDYILPSLIPDKGRVLTQISRFWFDFLGIPNHFVSDDLKSITLPDDLSIEQLSGRSMIVKKCDVVPVECVVRGYLVGSGWKDYQASGHVCGIELPPDLTNCAKFDEPIFTPATKEESGHDQNIPFGRMGELVGTDVAEQLRDTSLMIYQRASDFAAVKGIIVADTKFEFGWHHGSLTLIDEVLTPDSSRFWPADQYQAGRNQLSFDKQFVREYLESTTWDKNSDPPELPVEVVEKTREKYIEAFERLTGSRFPW